MVNQLGSCACTLCSIIRAIGLISLLLASLSRIIIIAEAPSEIELAFAAVTVPSFAKAGRKAGIFSGRALPGCSSVSITISPLRFFTVTGVISFLKWPFSMAAFARDNDDIANSSCASRVKPYFSAVFSANTPIKVPLS